MANSIPNRVSKKDGDTLGTDLSEFEGPRGTVTALTLMPTTEVNAEGTASPSFYRLYGKLGQTETQLGVGSGATLYDIIDTTIYVKGMTTGAQLQIPLRIVRKQG
jgi:hypothetical protein